MGFWPTGPFTTFSMVVVFTTATAFFIWGRSEQRFIASALLVSWVGARTATVTDNQVIYCAFLTVAAGLSLTPFTFISRLISILYVMRIAIVIVLTAGFINWFWLWEVNRILLWVQILLAWGTIASGPGKLSKRNDANLSLNSRRGIAGVFGLIWPRKAPLSEKAQTNGKADC